MADEVCIVVNPTDTAMTNINTEGEDVPARSYLRTTNPLSDVEQGAITAANGLVMAQTASDEEVRLASKILRLGQNPGE